MSRMHGIPPRQYACRGGMITAKEAADHFGISIKTMYNRLKKCGDNMDAVWNYYENHSKGGGKRPMKKFISDEEYNGAIEKQKQQRAVDEIAEILCGRDDGRRIPKETMNTAPAGYNAEDPGDSGEEPAPEQMPELSPATISAGRIQADTTDARAFAKGVISQEKMSDIPVYKEAMEIAHDHQREIDCRSLAMHNNAIDALDALIADGIEDDIAAEKAEDLLDRLRQVRINTFEHMVPWAKIARECR